MNQTSVSRTFAAALLVFASTPNIAKGQAEDSLKLWVEVPQSAPSIEGVVIRGDSVLFWTNSADSISYLYDRARKQFSKVPASGIAGQPKRAMNALSMLADLSIVDSLSLGVVQLPDGNSSAVIRDSRGRATGLRAVRIAAERRWRKTHRLPGEPSGQTGEEYPGVVHPTDWSPIAVFSYAIDSNAIWIGLQHDSAAYLDYALGGLLRLDRRTRQVSVIEHTAIIHSTISQIEPVSGGLLLIADGHVLRFDTSTNRVTKIEVPYPATELQTRNDTVFVASGENISVASLRDRTVVSRGFHMEVRNDGIVYELADSTIAPSWDTLAVISAGQTLGIRRMRDWMRAAIGVVRPIGLEYYYTGDRYTGVVPINDPDTVEAEWEDRRGPTGIIVAGFTDPLVRPFLRQSMLERQSRSHDFAAKVLAAVHDTAAIPFLRASLKNDEEGFRPSILDAMISLGDIAGVIGVLTHPSMYGSAVLQLVRLAGTGVDAMHDGYGTPAQRAQAQRWWMNWYEKNRGKIQPVPNAKADSLATAMVEKLKR